MTSGEMAIEKQAADKMTNGDQLINDCTHTTANMMQAMKVRRELMTTMKVTKVMTVDAMMMDLGGRGLQ